VTLTWREELTLEIERVKAVLGKDIEDLYVVLNKIQEKILEEDRELRQLRAAKREKTKIKDLTPAPDQQPLEKIKPEERDADLAAEDLSGGHR